MQRYDINPLYGYLTTVAGKDKTDWLFNLYKVGTSKMWNGATVFWQIDVSGNVRAGKIMGYDAKTGHRVKQPFNQVIIFARIICGVSSISRKSAMSSP